ncbi:hypothetical protein B0H14DRAFT_2590890 [Mycena olivaceomarginata]|nr:hypothetical protein B0H14DRAFT_2590890 [Mycena olivaceomarginata]
MAPANATCHFIPPDVILETSGALLIGFLIQHFLLGVVVVQSCTYYSRFHRRDIKFYRYLVGVILLVNFLHAGMNIHMIYRTSITAGYSESPAFGSQGWTMWAEPGVTAIVVLFAQFFFLDRCWSVIKRPWTILPLFGLHMAVLLPVGSGLAMSVLSFKVKVLTWIRACNSHLNGSDGHIRWGDKNASCLRARALCCHTTKPALTKLICLSIQTSFCTAASAIVNLTLVRSKQALLRQPPPQKVMCRYPFILSVASARRPTLL